ncbi:MAG: ECF transporter S component [Lachnospira sp.]|nr:ECF transporter S component [Lachnospira sp.]
MNNKTSNVTKLCLASMFIAIGWLLPFVSGQNTELGNMLCLMHIPVLVAGYALGAQYGLLVGVVTPLTRFLIFGRPAIYPTAVCMAVELAGYGFLSGLIYGMLKKSGKVNDIAAIYISLISAMIGGRLLWGVSRVVCGVFSQSAFTWSAFVTAGFVTAIPGMLIQLFLIPAIVMAVGKINKN